MALSKARRRLFDIWNRLRTLLRDHVESLLLAVVMGLIIRWFVVSSFVIRSDEMTPNFLRGEIVLGFHPPFGVELWGLGKFKGRLPKRGESLIMECPERDSLCLKRVVGLPGDGIEYIDDTLKINGQSCQQIMPEGTQILKESCLGVSYLVKPAVVPTSDVAKMVVPPDSVWVLNDNRDITADSRAWGVVPLKNLKAKAFYVVLSLDWGRTRGPLIRWNRSFLRVR